MFTYVIYPMLNKQKKYTSGEIFQIFQIAFFQQMCYTPEISDSASNQDRELTYMIHI